MSLNKWKAWPVENSKIMLKIDKKLVTMKRGSCDQFLAKIKFSDPGNARDKRIRNFFLIDFHNRNVEIRVRMWKLWPVWKLAPN
jgi:hypothetical protein